VTESFAHLAEVPVRVCRNQQQPVISIQEPEARQRRGMMMQGRGRASRKLESCGTPRQKRIPNGRAGLVAATGYQELERPW
jgi:hypothetical protein